MLPVEWEINKIKLVLKRFFIENWVETVTNIHFLSLAKYSPVVNIDHKENP